MHGMHGMHGMLLGAVGVPRPALRACFIGLWESAAMIMP